MVRMCLARVILSAGLMITGALVLFGQDTAAPRSLEGVWGAKRNFGPEIAGTLDSTTLEVFGVNQDCRASIAQYDIKCVHQNGRISFDLPSDQGSFTGRLQENGAVIRGFWIQPPTVNTGAKFASPVVLRSKGKDHWQGEVVPLHNEFTLYLVLKRRPDGSMGAFIRNPDRNIGVLWKVDRLEQDGNQLKLVGEPKGGNPGRVYAEGVYHPDDNRISLYTNRGGTYDLDPVSDDSSFYARGKNPSPYRYRRPIAEEDGWKVGTLEEVGMEQGPISELVRTIDSVPVQSVHDPYVHGFLVARHGKLVAEEYFYGSSRFKPHDTRSASKSVTATLFGAVMQNGAKLSPSTKVYDLLDHGNLPADIDPRKKEMTVEHLLTMSSGYDCDDSNGSRPGSEDVLLDEQKNPDYYQYTLQLPLEAELKPGQEAVYCSINPNLVGDVIATATNKPLLDLFSDLLAEPMQLRDYHLYLQPTGEPYMGGGTHWLPRDFMKFGQLMLNGGVWNGKRILSREYVDRASSPLVTIRNTTKKYGYLWWVADFPYRGRTVRAYYADGNGGNYVLVFPELDMVVAFNAGNYADHAARVILNDYVPKFILAALKDESR
jgi:CubicO group peptidase (beta-lactamase class C family)